MPTYDAKCSSCEHVQEYYAPITHDEPPPCEKCGAKTQRTVVANVGGVILKGRGWYKPGGFQ